MAPLIKSIQESDSEQLYLRSLDKFVEEKENEIEKICQGNYEVSARLEVHNVRRTEVLKTRILYHRYQLY